MRAGGEGRCPTPGDHENEVTGVDLDANGRDVDDVLGVTRL